MSKLFTKEGTRLHRFAGDGEHVWELRDNSGNLYFTGNAEELNQHIKDNEENGNYSDKPKKGRRKK